MTKLFAFCGAVLVLLFVGAHSLSVELNHDEEQFVAAGALLLRAGLLPYRDYPFLQMPNLAFIYGALFATNDYLLLTARCFNLACAAALVALVFVVSARKFGSEKQPDWILGLGCAGIMALHPLALFTMGRAWNHDLPVLATAAALMLLLSWANGSRGRILIFSCGLLLGLAIGTRLTFALVPAAFAVVLVTTPTSRSDRVKNLTIFALGLSLALLPAAILLASAPEQFVFGNLTYHTVVEQHYQQHTYPHKITFIHRLLFALKQLIASASTLPLLVVFWLFGLRPSFQAGSKLGHRQVLIIALVLVALFIGCCWMPIPPHRQYYYAVIPILLLGNIYVAASQRFSSRLLGCVALLLIGIELVESLPELLHGPSLLRVSHWETVLVHRQGMEVRARAQHGPILTSQPIYPLEGGLSIYKELATGQFVWRTAFVLSEDQRKRFGIVDPAHPESFLSAQPPTAAITGAEKEETKLPKPLLQIVQRDGYSPEPLDHRWTIWVQPAK